MPQFINFIWVLVTLSSLIKINYSANIFCAFPWPAYSHQQPLLTLSRALANRGHNLTVITTNPTKVPIKNYREIDIGFLYGEFEKLQSASAATSVQTRRDSYSLVSAYPDVIDFFSERILESPQVKNLIEELRESHMKYDLMIYETNCVSSVLGFAGLINHPPSIGMISFPPIITNDVDMGNPFLPSYNPSIFLNYGHKMSFWERLNNFCFKLYFLYILKFVSIQRQEVIMKKHFGELKYTAEEMERNKSLLIITTDISTDYPRAVNPNTVYVGPLHLKTPEPLPQSIKKWMDDAEDGVIYFSLGSNVKGASLPEQKRAAFIKAFTQFPKIRVLWKWEIDTELPGQPTNVLVKKWLPQQSILAHPKMKVFISQVGLQSLQESIYHVVPILGVPIYADQDFNSNKLIQSGAGLKVDFHAITYEDVYEKLKQLLTNNSFKENMKRLSAIATDKQVSSPLETAIWWAEYVIRHKGASHLRPMSLDLYWYQHYFLDIIGFIVTLLFLILVLLFYITRKLTSIFCKIKIKSD